MFKKINFLLIILNYSFLIFSAEVGIKILRNDLPKVVAEIINSDNVVYPSKHIYWANVSNNSYILVELQGKSFFNKNVNPQDFQINYVGLDSNGAINLMPAGLFFWRNEDFELQRIANQNQLLNDQINELIKIFKNEILNLSDKFYEDLKERLKNLKMQNQDYWNKEKEKEFFKFRDELKEQWKDSKISEDIDLFIIESQLKYLIEQNFIKLNDDEIERKNYIEKIQNNPNEYIKERLAVQKIEIPKISSISGSVKSVKNNKEYDICSMFFSGNQSQWCTIESPHTMWNPIGKNKHPNQKFAQLFTLKKDDPNLIVAVKSNDVEFVKYLLEKGANPNITDENGEPIIKYSQNHSKDSKEQAEIQELLLQFGADQD